MLLEVNSYVQKGHKIQLNCSADSIPVDKTVEFLANDETVTNIRKHDGDCFNTIYNRICSSESCSCSANDRYYVLFFRPPYGRTKTTFQCKMKLIRTGILYSNKVIVTILGEIGISPYFNLLVLLVNVSELSSNSYSKHLSRVSFTLSR